MAGQIDREDCHPVIGEGAQVALVTRPVIPESVQKNGRPPQLAVRQEKMALHAQAVATRID